MLKSGGDGFVMFKENTLLKDCVMIDNQVLIVQSLIHGAPGDGAVGLEAHAGAVHDAVVQHVGEHLAQGLRHD